jgi:hypothetical protein
MTWFPDKLRNDTEFIRASGESECSVCGKIFYKHPRWTINEKDEMVPIPRREEWKPEHEWRLVLIKTCDGKYYKL